MHTRTARRQTPCNHVGLKSTWRLACSASGPFIWGAVGVLLPAGALHTLGARAQLTCCISLQLVTLFQNVHTCILSRESTSETGSSNEGMLNDRVKHSS